MCYTYDNLSRVTARTLKKLSDNSVVSTETFNYDAAGNVTSAPDSSFQYDTNNRLISFNGNTVSYDLDGNMLSNGTLTCTYDSANRLVSAGGHTYTYNAEDVRIRNLCAEEDTTYTYNTNVKLSMLLMKTTNGVVTKYVYGKGLIGEEVGGAFKTYHFDCRGSTIAITDASGNITDTFAYDTYGKLISRTGTNKVIFGYNGRDGVVTDDNGLIYMRARYYSPAMKRFINADIVAGEISTAITLNRFAYANGNPVSFVDPFGLWPTKEDLKQGWQKVKTWWNEDVVEPVSEAWNTYVAEPVSEAWNTYVAEPFNEYVAEPVAEAWDTYVAEPAKEYIVEPVKQWASETFGATISVGKEKSVPPEYLIFATVEHGVGYSKDFETGKPINVFVSVGENWWEFWEYSIGFDVNVNGYGAGISIGGENSFSFHLGDVSHEVGYNSLGRISHKVAYKKEDGYIYDKYSLNTPEIVAAAIAIYYATPYVVGAAAGLAYSGSAIATFS